MTERVPGETEAATPPAHWNRREPGRPLRLMLVAGEPSGDALGARLADPARAADEGEANRARVLQRHDVRRTTERMTALTREVADARR